MITYKYYVQDDQGQIEDQLFDNFADAYDYAQDGLVTFITRIPYLDGEEQEDGYEIVWSWDDTHNREEAIAREQGNFGEEYPVDEELSIEVSADEASEIVDLADALFGDNSHFFDTDFDDVVPAAQVEIEPVAEPETDEDDEEEIVEESLNEAELTPKNHLQMQITDYDDNGELTPLAKGIIDTHDNLNTTRDTVKQLRKDHMDAYDKAYTIQCKLNMLAWKEVAEDHGVDCSEFEPEISYADTNSKVLRKVNEFGEKIVDLIAPKTQPVSRNEIWREYYDKVDIKRRNFETGELEKQRDAARNALDTAESKHWNLIHDQKKALSADKRYQNKLYKGTYTEDLDDEVEDVECVWCNDTKKKEDCVYDQNHGCYICKACLPQVKETGTTLQINEDKNKDDAFNAYITRKNNTQHTYGVEIFDEVRNHWVAMGTITLLGDWDTEENVNKIFDKFNIANIVKAPDDDYFDYINVYDKLMYPQFANATDNYDSKTFGRTDYKYLGKDETADEDMTDDEFVEAFGQALIKKSK